jgi:hypothetical protein
MSIISGKNIKVRFGAGPTTHKITMLDINDDGGEIDTTNSESAGFYESEDSGISTLTVRMDGDYNVSGSPLVNFAPGSLVATVKLYLNGTAGQPFYDIPSFRVISVSLSGEVKGKIKFSITGKSNGTYTRPTS